MASINDKLTEIYQTLLRKRVIDSPHIRQVTTTSGTELYINNPGNNGGGSGGGYQGPFTVTPASTDDNEYVLVNDPISPNHSSLVLLGSDVYEFEASVVQVSPSLPWVHLKFDPDAYARFELVASESPNYPSDIRIYSFILARVLFSNSGKISSIEQLQYGAIRESGRAF